MKTKTTFRKLSEYAAIVVAIPTAVSIVSWMVVQFLPRDIKDLPAKVEAVQLDVREIKRALNIPQTTPDPSRVASASEPH